jgi:hypothetical protein
MDEFEPVHPSRSRLSWAARLLLLVPSLVLAFLLGLSWREGRDRAALEAAAEPRTVADARLLDAERHTVELFREASPSVAYITTISQRRNLFDRRVYEVPSGTGSGFVWDSQGHVVTNFHVMARAGTRRARQRDASPTTRTWEARGGRLRPPRRTWRCCASRPPREAAAARSPIGSSRELHGGTEGVSPSATPSASTRP